MAAHILILDHDLRSLRTMSERLTYAGYQVSTASRVQDAVLQGIVTPPDLLVSDMLLPELNGCDVRRLLTQIPPLAAIPMLFLSSQDLLPPELYQPAVGAVDVLKKPYDGDAFPVAVAALLARQTARIRLLAQPLVGRLVLDGASLLDVCQLLAWRAADGTVRLSLGALTAEWIWTKGVLVEASMGPLRGDAAFYAAIAAPAAEPAVSIEPPPPVPPRTGITKPLPELLAEAARRARDLRDGNGSSATNERSAEVNTEEAFLERLAATGLIERIAAAR
ncbi:MAG: response regulator [Nitrospiria bacterium]